MEVTSRLAEFAAGISYNALPADVRERPKMYLLDALAVSLGAVDFFGRNDEPLLERYLKAVAVPGPSAVIGYGVRTTPTLAAFANGTLIEALDYQDSNMDVLTHNGAPIIPAALAIAEQRDCRWDVIATAIVAGYEVHTRLLRTIQPGHWYRGFQGLGTFGTCGAATAAGRLLGLDAPTLAAALGVAGCIMPVSSSDNVFRAFTIKACIPGQAARCGISAAELARAGYRGVPLEGEPPQHHAPLHTLSDRPKLELALEGLNEEWHCRRVAFKPYPVGHLIVGPVEIVLDILKERPIKADEVEGIDIVTYKHAIFRTGKYATPKSSYIDAHFSIPYCVAVALIDGELTPRQIWKTRVRDPKIHELSSRIVLTEDPEMSKAYPRTWPVQLTIRLKSGESITRRVDEVKWSPERAPSWDEIAEKFRSLADPLIGPSRAGRAVEVVANLKAGDHLGALMRLLAPSGRRAARSRRKPARAKARPTGRRRASREATPKTGRPGAIRR